jgi:DNA polymerase-3 subunit delta'
VRLQDLVGQEHAVGVLERALGTGRVPHAYLFEGPTGTGKRTAALALALALDCEAPVTGGGGSAVACGSCETCRRILAGTHPDVLTFAPEGTQIVMDQAQEIVALGQRRPHEARARVIILDDADRLNANAANCLLKTLEEPAPGTHLVLVTAAPDRVLATIRSRTQRVRFRRVGAAALLALGTRRELERGRVEAAAALADGSVARFLELASADTQAVSEGARAVAALRAAARGAGIAEILDAAAALGDKEGKQALPEVLALLARTYRDALHTAAGAPELALLSAGGVEGLAPPTGLSLAALGRALAAIVEGDTALAANVNPVMALERMLLALRAEERTST